MIWIGVGNLLNRFADKPTVYTIANYIEKAVEMVFPPKCIFCGCLLETGLKLHICGKCHAEIPFARECILRPGKKRSGGCDHAIYVCSYSGIIKESLIRFKFFNKPVYYRTFARLLAERLSEAGDDCKADIIASVPLYKERQLLRGYNQAALLAEELGRETGVRVGRNLLSRVRNTEVQSLLTGKTRENNILNAFKVNDNANVKGKAILLVDDVLTTGSTVDECSRVLKEAGASKVIAAVIAAGRKY